MSALGRGLACFACVACVAALASCGAPEPVRRDPPPPPPAAFSLPPPLAPVAAPLAPSLAPLAPSVDAGVPVQDAGPRGVLLTASLTGSDRLYQGQGIAVVITLANATAEEVTIAELPSGLDYDPVLVGRDGAERPRTRFGKKRVEARAAATALPRTLKPGEEVKTSLLVSRIVDTSDAGAYRLKVVRRADGKRDAMISNEVELKVY